MQNSPAQQSKFVAVDFLDGAPASAWREGQYVIQVWTAQERIAKTYCALRSAEINERPHAGVAPIGNGSRQANQSLAVSLIAKEQVAPFDRLPKIAQARRAADPTFIAHRVRTAAARAEIFIEFPAPSRINFKNPDAHKIIRFPARLRLGFPIPHPSYPARFARQTQGARAALVMKAVPSPLWGEGRFVNRPESLVQAEQRVLIESL